MKVINKKLKAKQNLGHSVVLVFSKKKKKVEKGDQSELIKLLERRQTSFLEMAKGKKMKITKGDIK